MMRAMLRPAPGARNAIPAMILGEVSYDAGLWKLTALAQNIYGSTLYQLFDPDIGSGIGEILDNIGITSLGIEYHYAARGGATSFSVDGDLVIGSLGLTLDFTHDPPTQWRFEAHLDVSRTELGKATLSDVLAYLFGDTVTSEMPAFIRDIPVIPPRDEKAVGFDMAALPAPGGSPGTGSTKERPLLFTAWLSFLDMTFQGVQYQGVTPEGAGGSVGSNRPRPRRIFELVVNSLPAVDIPLVGNLTQPFDEMLLLYVHPEQGDTAESGLTFAEARAINDELRLVGRRQLPYRATKKFADEDVVLTIGAHFILVLKGPAGQSTVALDYVFYVPTLTPRKPSSGFVFTGAGAGGSETAVTAPPGTGPGPAKAPYEKRIGPLSIRNMGFQFTPAEKPVLSIIMDASIAVGPIALDLLGFGLDLSFDKGVTLFQLPTPCPRIAGLGVAFDRPPVVIAGMFEHRHEDLPVKRDWYQGAATLSFQPYLFTAAGYYGTTTTASSETFISAFVYFILHGPLVELEFAEINGVMGGFGYNTFLQLPNPTNVLDFPFLRNPDSTDPNQELAALVGGAWFFPQNGAFWLAAGLSVKALQMLQVRLVLVVEWNPNVQLGLYGVATADMPAGNQESLKMLHAELGVTATFDFGTDALRIEGQLAPSSYVWDPFCHLRGGFAYYQWFRGAEPDGAAGPIPAGDFVFTVGGYHRNFQPPAQYPSNVPRLGISWSFDSAISITGEAYFAITPNVAMAGGRLDASLSLGPLSAWFDAWADLLINYKPFHFTAVGGVSVGVRFTLDLWICTIHISVEIGATLYLAGPALHGTVHVDFWVFGFDIDFGDDSGGPAGKLGLEQFYDLALQADLSKAVAAGASTGTGDDRDDPPSASPPPHVYSCNEGLVPTGSTESTPNKDDEPWRVRGAVFRFTVGCKFAIDSADVVTAQTDPHAPPIPPLHIPGNGQPIYARPMHCTKRLDSTLTVTITPVDSPTKGPLLTGQDHGDAPPPVPVWDNGVPVVKPVPKAVWGLYSAADDPNDPNNPDPNHNSNLLQPTNTSGDPSSPTATLVPLTMGITLSSPLPRIATDCIPAFAYETFFVRPVGDPVAFPAPKASNAAWYPRALPLAHGTTTSTTGTSTSTSDVGGSDEWEYVRSRWSGTPGLGSGAAEAAVKTWAALSFATGWQVDTRPGDISGKAPEKMLEEGTFQTLFLEAPMVCAFPGRGA
ncbi:uncharacterized protein B0T15DRAFT_432459 [Chaetomium strumarium]|uniref:DUF6603 domain-containing protein n=1 Tax=Chaetomium strumarium TaxID=1170767 RepID=A0AAJ0M2Z4_9PEZI|nr:hypothetical protein B0T15DRAFT_432459 [Chaetomium strumarium]